MPQVLTSGMQEYQFGTGVPNALSAAVSQAESYDREGYKVWSKKEGFPYMPDGSCVLGN